MPGPASPRRLFLLGLWLGSEASRWGGTRERRREKRRRERRRREKRRREKRRREKRRRERRREREVFRKLNAHGSLQLQ